MTDLEYEKNKDRMRPFVLGDGRCYRAFKTSGFFCKHCTDIFYDFGGPYALVCDLNDDTSTPCWSGTCEHFEQEEIEEEPIVTNGQKFVETFGIGLHEIVPVYTSETIKWLESMYQKPDDDIQHVGYTDEQLGREK